MDETVLAQLADTKAAAEVQALDSFYKMLAEDEDRAFYGEQYVQAANDNNAIHTLLISDALFRYWCKGREEGGARGPEPSVSVLL